MRKYIAYIAICGICIAANYTYVAPLSDLFLHRVLPGLVVGMIIGPPIVRWKYNPIVYGEDMPPISDFLTALGGIFGFIVGMGAGVSLAIAIFGKPAPLTLVSSIVLIALPVGGAVGGVALYTWAILGFRCPE